MQKNIPFFRIADRFIAGTIARASGIFIKRRSSIPKTPQGILCVSIGGIGTSILVLPSIKAISKIYPKAELTVLCNKRSRDVFINQPFIKSVKILDISFSGVIDIILKNYHEYDIAVDFEEYIRTTSIIVALVSKSAIGFNHKCGPALYNRSVNYDDKKHSVETRYDIVRLIGANDDDNVKLVSVRYSQDSNHKINDWFVANTIEGQLFGIAPGAAETARTRIWPREHYAELITKIVKNYNASIVITGAEWDNPIAEKIISLLSENDRLHIYNTCGLFSLEETFALTDRLDLMVTNDSGSSHIAASLNVPCVTLFGPNSPQRWAPISNKSKSIYHKLNCSPCIHSHLGVFPKCKLPGCSDTAHCMKEIKVKDVFDSISALLD